METIELSNKETLNTYSLVSCDICYKDITNKVTLECKHELCVTCFLEMTSWSKGQIRYINLIPFKCHMCRKQYNWKKEECNKVSEETLSILIREDESNQFRALVGMETSRIFEVIVQEQHVIQFIVILGSQMDTETLKFLISEFIANNFPSRRLFPFPFSHDNLMQNLRRPVAFSHFKNTGTHLESFYDNLVIKKYEE